MKASKAKKPKSKSPSPSPSPRKKDKAKSKPKSKSKSPKPKNNPKGNKNKPKSKSKSPKVPKGKSPYKSRMRIKPQKDAKKPSKGKGSSQSKSPSPSPRKAKSPSKKNKKNNKSPTNSKSKSPSPSPSPKPKKNPSKKNKKNNKSPTNSKSKSPSPSPSPKPKKNPSKKNKNDKSKSPKSPKDSKQKKPKKGDKGKSSSKSKSKSPNNKNKNKPGRKGKSKGKSKSKNKSKKSNKNTKPPMYPNDGSDPGPPIRTKSPSTDIFRRPSQASKQSREQIPSSRRSTRVDDQQDRDPETAAEPLPLSEPVQSNPEPDQQGSLDKPQEARKSESKEFVPSQDESAEPVPSSQDPQDNNRKLSGDGVAAALPPTPPEQSKGPSLVGKGDSRRGSLESEPRRRHSSVDPTTNNNDIDMLTPTAARGIPGVSGYYKNRTVDDVADPNRRRSSQSSAGAVVSDSNKGSRRASFDMAGGKGRDGDGVLDMTVYNKKSNSLKPTFMAHKAHLITPQTLYQEALYTSVHYLGLPTVRFPSSKEDLCLYSHVAFKTAPKDQAGAMEHVVGEAFPLTVVNTNVRRADGVEVRENGDLPDPYCVVGVESQQTGVDFALENPEWERIHSGETPLRTTPTKSVTQTRPPPEKRLDQIYEQVPSHIKTSAQPQTKKPSWDQRFQCLALRPSVDVLTIELWDNETDQQNIQESKSKHKSKSKLKGGLGSLGKLSKTGGGTGKHDLFLGKVSVPVADVPCEGLSKWHFIQGISHRKKEAQGRLLLEVWLTQAYRHGKNYEEYGEPRIVLEMLWDHILQYESGRFAGEWNGDIPPAASCLLFQYALQTGISEASQAIVRWNAYAKYNLGLYAMERRLTELENALEKARDWKDVRECELEAQMTMVVIDKILPIIRNHFHETQDRVQEAVKAVRHTREILKKFQCKQNIFQVQFLIEAEIRMAALEWYEAKYLEYLGNLSRNRNSFKPASSSDVVECLARLLNEVNALMRECLQKWKPLFWMDGLIDYMPLVYDEFQKMIVHDVEFMCWSTLRFWDTNAKLRYVLTNLDAEARRLCRALFDLYVQTQVFVLDQESIFDQEKEKMEKGGDRGERYYFMNRYHRWFRPVLVLWLGYALIKAADMISTSIKIDNVIVDNENMMTSSSATDAGLVYSQLSAFWQQLNWPDVAEGYVILHYLFEVMCFITIMYARLKRSKLEKEGYFDTVDRFDISQRLCTALNNIEFVKESLIKIPDETKMDSILLDLDLAVGRPYAKTHRMRIDNLLTGTLVHIEVQFKKILNGVGDRVRPEIRERFHGCFLLLQDTKTSDDDTLVPVLTYLEDNIVVLHKSLLELNFIRVLQMFWNVTCQEILNGLNTYTKKQDARTHGHFFKRVENILAILMAYFEGGGGGLNEMEIETKHYKALRLFLSCLSLPTNLLIATYYREAAEEQMSTNLPSKLGTLTVRVDYNQGVLTVEVMSAKNLSARDEPLPLFHWCRKQEESSDPQVEISLMPPQSFQGVKVRSYKTDIKWKTQHPVYNEKFTWQLAEDECSKLESVLVFTLRDYDRFSRDDFLGQAVVPIAQMPGLVKFKPVAQPMHLQLRSVDVKFNPILSILANRSWDTIAQTFASDQEKYVIVIKGQSGGAGAPLRLPRGEGV